MKPAPPIHTRGGASKQNIAIEWTPHIVYVYSDWKLVLVIYVIYHAHVVVVVVMSLQL